MYRFPIGVMLESFRLPDRDAIAAAKAIGAQGVQTYCTSGEHAPENMTREKKRELLRMMDDAGLVFSAICGDLGRGFGDPELNPGLIEKSKRIMELAKELGSDIVTTHIGVVPSDPAHDRYKVMQEACRELAEFADGLGSHFALETGPEPSDVLKRFLDSLGSRGVAVNLDPANLVMVVGDDPVNAVRLLKEYIVHTHAKDGIMVKRTNPEYVYGVTPTPEDVRGATFYRELPLGEGGVNFPAYLSALDEIGYRGFLTVEREAGDDPVKDIGQAAEYLRRVIAES